MSEDVVLPPPGDLAGAVQSLYEAAPILRGAAGAPPESMTVAGIVGAYYAALAVRAHAEAGARSAGAASGRGKAVAEGGGGTTAAASALVAAAAAAVLAAFDSSFHPRALARLEGLADGIARGLESGGGAGDNGDAAEYDRLREAMSAAEFARQYDRGLRGA